MNAVAPLITPIKHAEKAITTLPTRVIADPLTPAKRAQVAAYQLVCGFILERAAKGQLSGFTAFEKAFAEQQLPDDVKDALAFLRGKKQCVCPNRATLYRWLADYEKYMAGNALALTKKYTGRVRKLYGWEYKAIELFQRPSKPGYADVAFWLRTDYGFESATKSRVTRYLQTMPQTLGKESPGRMGKQFYKHNLSPYNIRDNTVLPVGFGYEGDGHIVDVYMWPRPASACTALS